MEEADFVCGSPPPRVAKGGGSPASCSRKASKASREAHSDLSRRPLRFWQPFNDWWRSEFDKSGKRPAAEQIIRCACVGVGGSMLGSVRWRPRVVRPSSSATAAAR